MYLWQIRHIPNHLQTLLRLTFLGLVICVAVVTYFPVINYAAGQAGEQPPAAANADQKPTPAEEFLDRVRQELLKHRTIKADMLQSVSIGDQQFKIEGDYVSAAPDGLNSHGISKLRLHYRLIPSQGLEGEILEICDGRELWTELKLPESKQSLPDARRVTRRDVQQILAAAVKANKQESSESTVSMELGLGGLSALLASLERSMTFDAMKEEQVDGHPRTIIQGRWKKDVAAKFPKDKDDALPVFIPDLVRLSINNETMFPEKVHYLKKQPQKKTYRSMITIEFNNVEFDGPVDDSAFVYNLPPGIDPENVTKQYLDRLTLPPAEAPATK